MIRMVDKKLKTLEFDLDVKLGTVKLAVTDRV